MKKEKEKTEKMENIGGRIPEEIAYNMRVLCAKLKIKQADFLASAIKHEIERQGK
jgi:hypothetical protein